MYTFECQNHTPTAQGLYDPKNEHDACGIGFVADIAVRPSHDIVLKGLQILVNLAHRGACGCDRKRGMVLAYLSRFLICSLPKKPPTWGSPFPHRGNMAWRCAFCRLSNSSGWPAKGCSSRFRVRKGSLFLVGAIHPLT